MFKIHDDKVYFVAETPDINKVIEIFLPKDDRGTIMDSHEIRVDLCRAVIHMEKKGVRVLKVRNIEDTNKASIDIWHMPEYQEAAESPVNDYYIIDMALAENSALNDCVPKNLLRAYPQQWLPGESNS